MAVRVRAVMVEVALPQHVAYELWADIPPYSNTFWIVAIMVTDRIIAGETSMSQCRFGSIGSWYTVGFT